MRYLHTMIRISDLEQSLNFYTNILGLIETRRYENEKARFTLIFLAAKDDLENAKVHQSPLIELTYNWPDESGELENYQSGRNFGHLAYQVDDIYHYCTHLQNHGILINRPPRDGRMAFIKSPDGISIEILQKGDALEIKSPWKEMSNITDW